MSTYHFMPAKTVYELDQCLEWLGTCLIDARIEPDSDLGKHIWTAMDEIQAKVNRCMTED